jgi:hypothetical protein
MMATGDAGADTSVQASFEVRLADLVRANAWHFCRSWALRLVYAGWFAAVGFLVIVRGPSIVLTPAPAAGTAALLLVVPFLMVWNLRRAVRRLKPEQLRKTYTFQPTQLLMSDGLADTRISWEALHHAVETSFAFHMFPQKNVSYFIPKRAFRSEDDVRRVRQILKDVFGPRATVRG